MSLNWELFFKWRKITMPEQNLSLKKNDNNFLSKDISEEIISKLEELNRRLNKLLEVSDDGKEKSSNPYLS
jgi:hypothetical protein